MKVNQSHEVFSSSTERDNFLGCLARLIGAECEAIMEMNRANEIELVLGSYT